MSRRPLIIHNPNLQTLRQRYAYAALTLAFWILWFYLWTPLITLVAWLLGADRFYDTMIGRGGIDMLMSMLGLFGLVILSMGTVFGGWALYNRWRVRGRDKRRGSPAVSDAELGEYFTLTPEQLALLRDSRRAVVAHDADGRINGLSAADSTDEDRSSRTGTES